MSTRFSRIRRFINTAYSKKYLLYTNVASYVCLTSTGDILSQTISNYGTDKKIDWIRTRRMAMVGLITGPMSHNLYKYLDAYKWAGSKIRVVTKKVIVDAILTPPFSFVTIFASSVIYGSTFWDAFQEYRKKFWMCIALDMSIWPLAQSINFWWLPPHYRVLYTSCVNVFYNCGLSYIKHHTDLAENIDFVEDYF